MKAKTTIPIALLTLLNTTGLAVRGNLTVYTEPIDIMARVENLRCRDFNVLVCQPTCASNQSRASNEIFSFTQPQDIVTRCNEGHYNHVCIDQAHYAQQGIIKAIKMLLRQGVGITTAGCDKDRNGNEFGSMPSLLAIATTIFGKTGPSLNEPHNGELTVFAGPMYSGKTERLIDVVSNLRAKNINVFVCKPSTDIRVKGELYSRAKPEIHIEAIPFNEPKEILAHYAEQRFDHLCIDEVQFAHKELMGVLKKLMQRGVGVTVSGLDTDFKANEFGSMPSLLTLASFVEKLTAICQKCHDWNATLTQRLVNGKPARKTDPLIFVDGTSNSVTYEPRCAECYQEPQ